MTSRARFRFLRLLPLAALALLSATASQAQFKVIGPDGKVTYTDREPTAAEGKVVPLGSRAATVQDAASDLPFELRQTAGKYPVTLYVVSGACDLCSSARQLLKQRGVPFNERTVATPQDAEALQRLTGGQDAPALAIGSQTLRGLAPDVWNSYLDAAGYPRTSKLPAGYQYRAATPLVEQPPAPRADAAPPPPPSPSPSPSALPGSPGGIRF